MRAAPEGDQAGDVAVRHEAAGGLAGVWELLLRLITRDAVALHVVLQATLDGGRQHGAGTDRVAGDRGARNLQRDGAREADKSVLAVM